MARTPSIFSLYSSSISATHHIFFPPRLQVVAEQQNPDGLPADPATDFSPYSLLADQPHCPSGCTFRWRPTDHRNNLLVFSRAKSRNGTRPLALEQGHVQTFLKIFPSNSVYRHSSTVNRLRNFLRPLALIEHQ